MSIREFKARLFQDKHIAYEVILHTGKKDHMNISENFSQVFLHDSTVCKNNIIAIKTPFVIFMLILENTRDVSKVISGKKKPVTILDWDFSGDALICLLRLLDFFQVSNTELLLKLLEPFYSKCKTNIFDINYTPLIQNIGIKYDENTYFRLIEEKKKQFDLDFISLIHLFDNVNYYNHNSLKEKSSDSSKKTLIKDYLYYKDYLINTYSIVYNGKIQRLWDNDKRVSDNNRRNMKFISTLRRMIFIDELTNHFDDIKVIFDWEWNKDTPEYVAYRNSFDIYCMLNDMRICFFSIILSRTHYHESIIIHHMTKNNLIPDGDRKYFSC